MSVRAARARRWRALGMAALVALVAGCAPPGPGPMTGPDVADRRAGGPDTLPPARRFAEDRAPPWRARPNAELAQDFEQLFFFLESGRELPVFSRFEGPVRVAFARPAPPGARAELETLAARIRREAGIPFTVAPDGSAAEIIIELIPREALRRAVPQAACFVVPRMSSWQEFTANRRSARLDWTTVVERERALVVAPADSGLQELRDCLHEEVAQALGPLNDIYGIADSVFNDDNVQGVLTRFDMLMLRAAHAPELRSGMSREEVRRRLPAILARIHPQGEGMGPGQPRRPDPRDWTRAIETAMSPVNTHGRRLGAAREAVRLAQARGLDDHRLGFSLYVQGRLLAGVDRAAARRAMLQAEQVYIRTLGPRSQHRAFAAAQLALLAAVSGDAEVALGHIEVALPGVMEGRDAAVLSTLLMLRAELYEQAGRMAEARAARLDSLGWARYAFPSEQIVRNRLREVAALVARGEIRMES